MRSHASRAGAGGRAAKLRVGVAAALAVYLALAGNPGPRAQEPPTPAATPAPTAGPTPEPAPAPPPLEPSPAPTAGVAGQVAWRELHYSAHKFFLSATTTIHVERLGASELGKLLRRPPGGHGVALEGREAAAVSVESELPFGRDERVTLWLDPASGSALGAEKLVLGRNPYRKVLRFVPDGLYTWRSSPRDAREAGRAPGTWKEGKPYLVAPAVRPPSGTPVTDSYGLLYLVATARLDRKDGTLHLVMLADDGFIDLGFEAGGLSYRRASFDLAWPGGGVRRDGDVLVRTVRATAHALERTRPRRTSTSASSACAGR